eukprot:SAG31_NODE_15340_length_759_cov_7.548485_1_plen_53_part_00
MLGGPAELSLGSSLRLHWSGAVFSLSLSINIAFWTNTVGGAGFESLRHLART